MSSDFTIYSLNNEEHLKNLPKYYEDKIALYKTRLTAIHLLRSLKEIMGYSEMSKTFNINISLLCRYAKGHVIPSYNVARSIISTSIKLGLINKVIRRSYEETGQNVINPNLFQFISEQITDLVDFKVIDKIVCFFPKDAILGITLALNTGRKLIFAYNEKHFFPEKRHEYDYHIKSSLGNEDIRRTIAIPKNVIKSNDKLAIIGFYLVNVEDYLSLVKLLKRIKVNVEVINCVFISSPNDRLPRVFSEELNKVAKECNLWIISKLI